MSALIKHYRPRSLITANNIQIWRLSSTKVDTPAKRDVEEEEFRVLDILKKRERQQRRTVKRADIQPDRADRMATDQVSLIKIIINLTYNLSMPM